MSMNISPATKAEILRRVTKYINKRSYWNIPMTNEEIIDIVEDVIDEVKYLPKKKKEVVVGYENSMVHIPQYSKFAEMRTAIWEDQEIDEFYEHDTR